MTSASAMRMSARVVRRRPSGSAVNGAGEMDRSVGFGLYPSQRRLFDNVANPRYKYLGFSGPVGSGKSRMLGFLAVYMAMRNPGLPGMITAPTYRMLKDVTQEQITEVLHLSDTRYKVRGGDNSIYLPEFDSTIRLRSTDNPIRLVGGNLAWFGCDELTYTKPDAWRRLQARLRHPKAKLLRGFAVWTPNGFDWVYSMFIRPETRSKDHLAILGRPNENKAVLQNTPDYYDSMQTSYDPRFYRQEALGEYLNITSGQVYYTFDRYKNHAPAIYTPGLPIYLSMDFNVDPMTGVICQCIPKHQYDALHEDTIRVIDEIYLGGSNTREACRVFVDKVKKYCIPGRRLDVKITGDHTGSARKTSSDESDYEVIRRFFADQRISSIINAEIIVPSEKNPPVRARINAVNSKLCNAVDERFLLIDTVACPALTRDLEEVVWDKASAKEDQIKDRKLTHISSALGYMIYDRYAIRTAGGFVKKGFY